MRKYNAKTEIFKYLNILIRSRRRLFWIRDTVFPLLVPLLKLAYEAAETNEHRAKVTKVKCFVCSR